MYIQSTIIAMLYSNTIELYYILKDCETFCN